MALTSFLSCDLLFSFSSRSFVVSSLCFGSGSLFFYVVGGSSGKLSAMVMLVFTVSFLVFVIVACRGRCNKCMGMARSYAISLV